MNNTQASPRLLSSSQAQQQQSPAQTSRLRPTIALENNNNNNNNNTNNTNGNIGNDDDDNANAGLITPELLVDALSGHEDGLLTIAERLMTKYDIGYNAMGEAIVDAFADVQRLFQHVVEAAHMEGAALERERGESEWQTRLEELVGDGTMKELDIECALYGGTLEGDDESTMLDSVRRRRRPRGTDYDDGCGGGDIDDDDDDENNDERRGRGGGGGHNIIVPLIINPRTQFLDSDMKNLLIRMYEIYSLIHLDVAGFIKMPGGMPNVVDCMRRHVLLPRHYCPSIRTIVDDCNSLRHVLVG